MWITKAMFHADDTWIYEIVDKRGKRTQIPGQLRQCPRKVGRRMLEFHLGDERTKKFYVCEFCEAEGHQCKYLCDSSWQSCTEGVVYHTNFAAQHIPRRHPHLCLKCFNCGKRIFASGMNVHVKGCVRRQKVKPKSAYFEALPLPEGANYNRFYLDGHYPHDYGDDTPAATCLAWGTKEYVVGYEVADKVEEEGQTDLNLAANLNALDPFIELLPILDTTSSNAEGLLDAPLSCPVDFLTAEAFG